MSLKVAKLLSNANDRMKAHKGLLRLFEIGDYEQAIIEIRRVIEQHGPHIGLLLDLASAAYLAQKFSFYRVATQEALKTFNEIHGQLSDRSYQRSCLSLGKMLEEIAHVSEALELYDSAIKSRSFDRISYFDFYQKIQVQRLRLLTFAGKSEKVHELYNECFSFESKDHNFKVQITHGLMLSEIYIHNLESGILRWQELSQLSLSLEDRNLVLFDLLEESLRQSQKLNGDLEAELKSTPLPTLNFYEKNLLIISQASQLNIHMKQFQLWKENCSPLCYLKLLSLAYIKTRQPEVRQRLIFEINGLPQNSQKILRKIWQNILEEGNEVIFNITHKMISLGQMQIPLREASFDGKLIRLFEHQRTFTVEDLVRSIYEINQTDIYAHEKLRIAILRFNQKLEKKFHISQIIKLSQGKALLRDGVKFKRIQNGE